MNTTYSITILNTDTAIDLLKNAMNLARKEGFKASITIVDPMMNTVVFARDDGATPHSAETSKRKAMTAASTRKPTGWMPKGLDITLPLGSGNLLTNIPGGVPIIINDAVVGAIGIAGGTVEQDGIVAKAIVQKNL
jgi:glc operon protein GlcG